LWKNILILLGAVVILFGISFIFVLAEKGEFDGKVELDIPPGSTWNFVASQLSNKSVIQSKKPFLFAVRLLGAQNNLRSGTFEISGNWRYYSIIQFLQNGEEKLISVTIPEGWNLEQIAEKIEAIFGIESAKFLEKTSAELWDANTENQKNIIGFLFPDTYAFSKNVSPEKIIQTMLKRFDEQVTAEIRVGIVNRGFSFYEGITLASIIQGEVIFDEECRAVSSVYQNRIKKGMKLQADPTIQFILPGPPRRLYNKHLEIDSPYNTYKYYGLPPGPINNPGLEAIRAVAFPDTTKFLYFVARGDGYHQFNKTFRAHNRAKRKFRK